MGACQTAGGAATSGASITAPELAHAIREAARHPACKTSTPLNPGGEASPTSLAQRKYTFDEADYSAHKTFETQFQSVHHSMERSTLKVTSYCPNVFEHLRYLEGVTEEHFLAEWDLPEEKAKTALGEGRSMAMFMKSKNLDYMCKTIAQAEVDVLVSIIGKLDEYLTENKDSLLMRFLMLLRIEVRGDTGFLLVFSDVFATCPGINELWDLKGRHPKPGKFLNFPSRVDPEKVSFKPHKSKADRYKKKETSAKAKPDDRAIEVAKDDDEEQSDTAEALGHQRSSVLHTDDESNTRARSPTDGRVRVRKDKELTRLFWLEKDELEPLVEQLKKDFAFLSGSELMDYSILIGVTYKPRSLFRSMRNRDLIAPESPVVIQRRPNWKKLVAEQLPPSEAAPQAVTGRGSTSQHVSRCKYHCGVEACLGEEIYYIGIIDMLTHYNGKKKTANFCKTFLWEPDTLSTIPAPDYEKRISDYVDLIFASPPDE